MFQKGDRVRISSTHHWALGATATINGSRGEVAMGGTRLLLFDEPHDDGSGDGPCIAAEINEEALDPI